MTNRSYTYSVNRLSDRVCNLSVGVYLLLVGIRVWLVWVGTLLVSVRDIFFTFSPTEERSHSRLRHCSSLLGRVREDGISKRWVLGMWHERIVFMGVIWCTKSPKGRSGVRGDGLLTGRYEWHNGKVHVLYRFSHLYGDVRTRPVSRRFYR